MDRSRTDKRGLDDPCTGATAAPAVIATAKAPAITAKAVTVAGRR